MIQLQLQNLNASRYDVHLAAESADQSQIITAHHIPSSSVMSSKKPPMSASMSHTRVEPHSHKTLGSRMQRTMYRQHQNRLPRPVSSSNIAGHGKPGSQPNSSRNNSKRRNISIKHTQSGLTSIDMSNVVSPVVMMSNSFNGTT